MKNTFAVMVNYNNGSKTIKCLESLLKNPLEIVLVDNSSCDGSLEKIKQTFGNRVFLITNKSNIGFAKAANQGTKYSLKKGAKRVLLINPDTNPDPFFVKKLIKYEEGIVAPLFKFKKEGNWLYDHGGKINWLFGRTFHWETKNKEDIHKPVDYVTGCAMLIKKEVFHRIGYLDEKYFLYFEDVDYCLRASKAGFKIKVVTDCVVEHKLVPGKKKSLRSQLLHLKSNFIFINSYIPYPKRLFAYLYLFLLFFKIISHL